MRIPDDSPLWRVPTPDQVRQRIVTNSQESRLLRSLWKLSVKIHGVRAHERNGRSVGGAK